MPDRQQPVIAEGLVRTFGEVEAVRGVDITVAAGEIFGFLGPNGAGKSTTVRMLTTLLRPTAGRAFVAGFDVVKQADDVRRSIGVALQDAAIDPLMTGRELLRLQAILHGIPKTEWASKIDGLLERVGLTAAGDRRVGTYSGGMRRRLDLALSLIHEPKVMFLDEPTTGLDPNSRAAIWEEVRTLNRNGTTVFLTTQYMEEADQLADRIAIIDDGVIADEGTPQQLKAKVGKPSLQVQLADAEDALEAEKTLLPFGEPAPAEEGWVAVRLREGAEAVPSAVASLHGAGLSIHSLEIHSPTLDDVFQKLTGKRLEGAEEGAAPAAPAPEATRGRGRKRAGRRA